VVSIERASQELDEAVRELCASIEGARKPSDAMSETLRLQLALEQLNKVMAILSNVLKKASETSTAIIQHIR
jgi:hypothetical protein